MKALVKEKSTPGLWLREVNKPEIGDLDILVKVKKTSICGTDLHIYKWDRWAEKTIKTPMTIGHEFTGEVVAVGAYVQGFKIGDRISGEGHISCGKCRNCRTTKRHLCLHTQGVGVTRTGCFAEFVSIPAENAFHLPASINDDIAAVLDPLGNAVHTALAFNLVGEDVLITGAGPIGLMATAIAKHVGARRVVVTDMNPYRLELAKQMGATHAVNISKTPLSEFMKTFGALEGFDVGLEMSGQPAALRDMIDTIRPGCPIALLGILPENSPVDWHKIIFKGLTLQGIYGRQMYETWYKMIGMLDSGLDITPVLTHRFAFDDFEQGFDAMGSGMCGKVILEL
jgi:threonine 3-dehydrogenase